MTATPTLFRRGDLAVLEIQHSYDSVTDGRTVYTVLRASPPPLTTPHRRP